MATRNTAKDRVLLVRTAGRSGRSNDRSEKAPEKERPVRIALDVSEADAAYLASLKREIGLGKAGALRAALRAFRIVREKCVPLGAVRIEVDETTVIDATLLFHVDMK